MSFMFLNPRRYTTTLSVSGSITCPHVIALEEGGFSNVKLYPGDWSDWISYEGKSVATGEK
ncbi:hypothetical protein [Paenibacillus sp. FSL R7-0026]|uniref:hypothetical protein n=1 Tax=Paenibacillus sp. FSL R7-0026 TaxID=2921668 RepID=UPI004046E17E